MILDNLQKKGLINPPPYVLSNTMYLTITGSHAYGCADTAVKSKMPDMDTYGFCIPAKETLFPHTAGHIIAYGEKPGTVITFGSRPKGFEQWIKHGIVDKDAHGGSGQEYDFTIMNIVKYLELCRDNNPNMLDTLFTREECVLHCTNVGRMVRDARKDFVSKRIWKKFRGYAFSQLSKMEDKNAEGARVEIIEKFGYDVKFAYNVVRLLDEAEQLLLTGDMDLQRAKEAMKSVRRGEWKPQDIRAFFMEKDKAMEALYVNSKMREVPDEAKLKILLKNCLEEHYGSLDKVLDIPNADRVYLQRIKDVIQEANV
jgi:predicted nucleotidyltransferase